MQGGRAGAQEDQGGGSEKSSLRLLKQWPRKRNFFTNVGKRVDRVVNYLPSKTKIDFPTQFIAVGRI